ncbi:MAG: glycosyltransferase [Lachnospiraceae bacterium]|nr:glycosyltransferase [Lachnospiraceae bacterium]
MIKGIYFSQVRPGETAQGAVMKVFDEIEAMKRAGFEMMHVNAEPLSSGLRRTHLGKGVCAAIPFTCVFSEFTYRPEYDLHDFYYFRFEAADCRFTSFLKKLKERNPNAKIIIEFPDYPNTYWLKGFVYLPLLLKDIAARRKYRGCVDRFAVLDPQYKEICGVRTLNYMNGIDISRIPTRKPGGYAIKDRIDVIGVSTMFPNHGYDRFILSMAEYYKSGGKRKIVFHVVGEGPGPELPRYRNMVKEYGLADNVIFEGRRVGEDLYSLFDKCDLALECLGAFRKGLDLSSSLKSREYFAVGIPFVTGCVIDLIPEMDSPYVMKIANDESIPDMEQMLIFADSVYRKESEESVIANMRRFAEENCTYDHTLGEVIEYIRSGR